MQEPQIIIVKNISTPYPTSRYVNGLFNNIYNNISYYNHINVYQVSGSITIKEEINTPLWQEKCAGNYDIINDMARVSQPEGGIRLRDEADEP